MFFQKQLTLPKNATKKARKTSKPAFWNTDNIQGFSHIGYRKNSKASRLNSKASNLN